MYLTLVVLSFPTRKPLSWFVFGESEVRFLVRKSAILTFAQFSYASRSKCQEIALNWTTATFSTCFPVTQTWHPPSRQFTSKAIESASMINYCITQCNRALFEKLSLSVGTAFPEHQSSLRSSQKPATGLYPQPDESNPYLYACFNTALRSTPGCSKLSLHYPVKFCTDLI